MNDFVPSTPQSHAIIDTDTSTSGVIANTGVKSMDTLSHSDYQASITQSGVSQEGNRAENQHNDVTSTRTEQERMPLRQHVQLAVEQYFAELEGDMPINLYDTILQEIERPLLEVVLAQTNGNQSKSAKILGLNRGTLRKKMSQYGLM